MKNYLLFLGLIFIVSSCKLLSGSDSNFTDESKVYHLKLNPTAGTRYYYDIINETAVHLEIEGKKINNQNKSDVGVYYSIGKDSTGNFPVKMNYDKIRLYTKNGETETNLDAANAANSINPVEKMLGTLKAASITAVISPTGTVKEVNGYKELGAKLMEGFDPNDIQGKTMAQSQWDQVIGQGMIKKNMDQLFAIFPDSAVHLGEKWKLSSRQSGEFGLGVTTFYKLKAINESLAIIESEGDIESDATAGNVGGFGTLSNLKGQQKGRYEMDVKTGMMISCMITSNLEGIIQTMGREIPVIIQSEVKMNGRKIR